MNPIESANPPRPTDIVAVIGLTGSFGGAVARELARRGHAVRALVRDPARARAACEGLPIELVAGDAHDAADVDGLVRDADVLVFGYNAPYTAWDRLVPEASGLAFDAAARHDVTVLYPGNVYGLGPDYAAPLDEDAPRGATSRKGRLRNAVEASLAAACERGARAIVLRAGDYIGDRAPNAWFGMITAKTLRGGAIRWPGPADVPHAWAYLPDLAHAAAELLARRESLPAFATFHFAGHVTDEATMVAAIRAHLGDPARRVRRLPWWLFGALRPFVPMVRELFDVRYVWTEPVLLDGGRLRALLGPDLRETPLRAAVDQALRGLDRAAEDGAAATVSATA